MVRRNKCRGRSGEGNGEEKKQSLGMTPFKQNLITYLIPKDLPKTSIISVLHDSHELNRIVTKIFDSWQDISGELSVCANSWFLGSDSHVGFVDTEILR